MWYKILGAALILTAGFWVGENQRREWTRQVRLLEELLSFAEFLQVELAYRERLLPDLLLEGKTLSNSSELGQFLLTWATCDVSDGETLYTSLQAMQLANEESYQLRLLTESLGHSTLEDQGRLIQQFAGQIQRLLAVRRQEGVRLVRLWRYCGFFSATILTILLL